MNYNKGEPKGNTSLLMFWGSAQCFKKIGDGLIKVTPSLKNKKIWVHPLN
jgi:hypothetical protein